MTAPGDPQDRLIRGIVAKWQSLAASTLAGINGPYRDEKPANAAGHPYAVIKDDGCFPTAYTCERQLFESEVEIRVYAKTPEDASVQAAKVDAVFSSRSLSLSTTGVDVLSSRPVGFDYAKPDEGVWYCGLRYRFQLSRSHIP